MSIKSTPLRMCVGCRNSFCKQDLIRVVKSVNAQILLDVSFKIEGRGAYICKNPDCFKKAIKFKSFERSFKQKMPEDFYERIEKELC